jgi:hypothetical protein
MGNHEVASPALPYQGGLNIMKLRTAKNINLAEGRSDDILFGERLIRLRPVQVGHDPAEWLRPAAASRE